jgi:bifunctional UDP-N-acetylglucosamine pyrophosphorylase/glucosamine-1-phosphate N-acetyltransferase
LKQKDPLSIVILAAGEGVRMKSTLPKPLMEVAGKSMLERVVESCAGLSPDRIIVVERDEKVKTKAMDLGCVTVRQKEPLGTADALKAALPECPALGDVMVACADTPLVPVGILKSLYDTHKKGTNYITLLTSRVENPSGYGRVVKEGDRVVKIVEEKEASEHEKRINLINSGVVFLRCENLEKYLNRVQKSPKKGEYYLTDLVEIAGRDGLAAGEMECDYKYVQGINTPGQLDQAEAAAADEKGAACTTK